MAMKITEECINCNACVDECPREAIYEAEPHYLIDAEKCTGCVDEGESQCVPSCPVSCIVEA